MGRPIRWPARLEDPKIKHLGDRTLVVAADDTLRPEWRMARIGDVALLEKPADSRSPKRIDCYRVVEHNANGTAFKLDLQARPGAARLFAALETHAEPPDCERCRCGIRSCGSSGSMTRT